MITPPGLPVVAADKWKDVGALSTRSSDVHRADRSIFSGDTRAFLVTLAGVGPRRPESSGSDHVVQSSLGISAHSSHCSVVQIRVTLFQTFFSPKVTVQSALSCTQVGKTKKV